MAEFSSFSFSVCTIVSVIIVTNFVTRQNLYQKSFYVQFDLLQCDDHNLINVIKSDSSVNPTLNQHPFFMESLFSS